ncbi:MAG: hypothetical protein L0Z53_12895, partial [Acidobacteriales bacterium]|nr:hypothetical protein [Terriglobales bacterium]
MEGTYLLIWSSPRHWRKEIVFPGFTETEVGTKEKLWLLRNVDYKPLRVWELDWLLNFAGRLRVGEDEKAKKIRDRKQDESRLRCVELKPKNATGREVCLDPDRHVLLYEKQAETEREYGDYL